VGFLSENPIFEAFGLRALGAGARKLSEAIGADCKLLVHFSEAFLRARR
jgi:hypothetical protein